MSLSATFLRYFAKKDEIKDNHHERHCLEDLLIITILGAICRVGHWKKFCEFAVSKDAWLKTFLSLPNGVPPQEILGQLFSLINPKEFETNFLGWLASLSIDLSNERLTITKPLVSIWAAANHLTFGHPNTAEQSNEIEAIPSLLKRLDLTESIVTLNTRECQKIVVNQIIEQGADYILAVNANQESLFQQIRSFFADGKENKQFKKLLNRIKVEKIREPNHVETRRYTLISARDPLSFNILWPGFKSIGVIEVTRTINHQTERFDKYFLTSLLYERIDDFMQAYQQHWHVEVNNHWTVDICFNRNPIQHATENLETIKRLALNLIKQENSSNIGIAAKRKRALLDNQYLLKILLQSRNILNQESPSEIAETV